MAIGAFSGDALQRPSLEAALLGNTPMVAGGHPSNVGFQAYANAMQRRAGRQFNDQLGPYNELVAALMEQHGQRQMADAAAGHIVGARDTMADPVTPLFDVLEFAGMPGLSQDPMQELMNAGRALAPTTANVENTAAAAASLANAGQAMPQGVTPEQLQTGNIGPTEFNMDLINDPNAGGGDSSLFDQLSSSWTDADGVTTHTLRQRVPTGAMEPGPATGSRTGASTATPTTPEQAASLQSAEANVITRNGHVTNRITHPDGSIELQATTPEGVVRYRIGLDGHHVITSG